MIHFLSTRVSLGVPLPISCCCCASVHHGTHRVLRAMDLAMSRAHLCKRLLIHLFGSIPWLCFCVFPNWASKAVLHTARATSKGFLHMTQPDLSSSTIQKRRQDIGKLLVVYFSWTIGRAHIHDAARDLVDVRHMRATPSKMYLPQPDGNQ